jgi:hypothetical protein
MHTNRQDRQRAKTASQKNGSEKRVAATIGYVVLAILDLVKRARREHKKSGVRS